jgi:hypothetical protein
MPSVPAPADPGRDEDPDPMTAAERAAEREAWLDRLCAQDDDPSDAPGEYWDPESCAPPPGQDELTAAELAEVREAAADEMLALDAASTGRRGPGQAGSSRTFPGESDSRAAGFGTGMAWDVTPGCAQLAVAAGGPPPSATSSTTPRTRQAGRRASVMAVRSAGMTTGSSSSLGGRSTSFPTGPSGGPRRPGAATTPNPPATPSKRAANPVATSGDRSPAELGVRASTLDHVALGPHAAPPWPARCGFSPRRS